MNASADYTYNSWIVLGTVERFPKSLVMAFWLAFLYSVSPT